MSLHKRYKEDEKLNRDLSLWAKKKNMGEKEI